MLNDIKNIFNVKSMVRTILFATVPALLFYAVSMIVMINQDYKIMEIIRDFAQQMDESSFLGFLSSIGTWLWVSSAAIAFFTFKTGELKTNRHKELLFLLGLFSILLAVDDYFMIHDRYIEQNICYGTYMVLAIAMLLRHFKHIIDINGFAFLFAGTLLALSIFTDLIQDHLPFRYSHIQVFEEGFKFVGAGTWLYFVVLVASFRMTQMVSKKKKRRK